MHLFLQNLMKQNIITSMGACGNDAGLLFGASQVVPVVKNPPASAGDVRYVGSIPGLGRSSGGGHGNPLQYSCLENLMDRGAWWDTVRGVSKSRPQLK